MWHVANALACPCFHQAKTVHRKSVLFARVSPIRANHGSLIERGWAGYAFSVEVRVMGGRCQSESRLADRDAIRKLNIVVIEGIASCRTLPESIFPIPALFSKPSITSSQ